MGNDDPQSILTRGAPPADLTVAYGDDAEQVIDLRLPVSGQRGPLIVFLHGGFWMAEYDRAHVGPLAADLAAGGYPVACLEYRRIGQPGGGWPGTLADVAAGLSAVSWLFGGLVSSSVDLVRPIVAGHSAGGHLALWVATRGLADASSLVRAVLALAPVADLRRAYELGLGDGAVGELLGGGPDDVPDRYAMADPAAQRPPPVPTVIVHGLADDRVPVEIGREYAQSAAAAGADVTCVELEDTDHFAVIDPMSAAWPTVRSVFDGLAG